MHFDSVMHSNAKQNNPTRIFPQGLGVYQFRFSEESEDARVFAEIRAD